jgi:hypothetical protein
MQESLTLHSSVAIAYGHPVSRRQVSLSLTLCVRLSTFRVGSLWLPLNDRILDKTASMIPYMPSDRPSMSQMEKGIARWCCSECIL